MLFGQSEDDLLLLVEELVLADGAEVLLYVVSDLRGFLGFTPRPGVLAALGDQKGIIEHGSLPLACISIETKAPEV